MYEVGENFGDVEHKLKMAEEAAIELTRRLAETEESMINLWRTLDRQSE